MSCFKLNKQNAIKRISERREIKCQIQGMLDWIWKRGRDVCQLLQTDVGLGTALEAACEAGLPRSGEAWGQIHICIGASCSFFLAKNYLGWRRLADHWILQVLKNKNVDVKRRPGLPRPLQVVLISVAKACCMWGNGLGSKAKAAMPVRGGIEDNLYSV